MATPSGASRALVLAAMLLLYILILGGFFSRRSVGVAAGDGMAWLGFLSLGAFSWLFVLSLMRDALLATVAIARVLSPRAVSETTFELIQHTSAIAIPALTCAAVLLGLFNARRLARVKDVEVSIERLPPPLAGFTVVQLSDLHVGPTIKGGYVQAIVDATNALSPDVIALTGDLVDGSVDRLQPHTDILAGLRARHGVYLVTGNHEYYAGASQWVAEFRRLGLQVLLNEHRVLSHGGVLVVLAGVTDFSAGNFDPGHTSDPVAALRGAPANAGVRILLAHQPRSATAAAAAGFDLQLSGHTHGGQFWPWHYFVPLQQPYVAGLHRLNRMAIYVSRGTGYWGPPMRIGSHSEITRIRLVPAISI
jgi:predicted MPP superfamily phosphohydrolase